MSDSSTNIKTGWVRRHRGAITAVGLFLGAAIVSGYRVVAEARAEQRAAKADVIERSGSVDWVEFHRDVLDLRGEIRDERRSREDLTKQMGEFNGRLSKLEAAKK